VVAIDVSSVEVDAAAVRASVLRRPREGKLSRKCRQLYPRRFSDPM
jgi:hypothetical protein